MGRLFVTNIQGPAYKCKHCKVVELVAYGPSNRIEPPFEYSPSLGKLYIFLKFFNVVIKPEEAELTSDEEVNDSMHDVFCIACGSLLGFYSDRGKLYNEGNFYINRFKLSAPNAESDDDDDDDDDENPGTEEDPVLIQE